MAIEADIRSALLTMNAVTAIVGTGSSARIRPDRLHEDDDDSLAWIVIEIDDERRENDLQGQGGLIFASVNILCRAKTKAAARALAEAVRVNGTNPGTGLAGYGGGSGATFDSYLESTATSYTPADDGSDQGFYDVNMQFTVIDSETT